MTNTEELIKENESLKEENKKLRDDVTITLVDIYKNRLDAIYAKFENNIEGNEEYYTNYLYGAVSEIEWEVENNLPVFANNLSLKERYNREIETYEDYANQQDSKDEDVINAKASIRKVRMLLAQS